MINKENNIHTKQHIQENFICIPKKTLVVVDSPRSLSELTIYPTPKGKHKCCQSEKPLAAIWRGGSGWKFPGIPWVTPAEALPEGD